MTNLQLCGKISKVVFKNINYEIWRKMKITYYDKSSRLATLNLLKYVKITIQKRK